MKKSSSSSGSMDMLLDTMCNTFGGVCFIALMVAIMSAAMPARDEDGESVAMTARQIAAKEESMLRQHRDMLQAAIEIQSKFVETASTGVVAKADLAKMAAAIAGNEEAIKKYERKRAEYLDELAKVKTRTEYRQREAERLARLLKELEEKAGGLPPGRHRVVRVPNEREIMGLDIVDVWLHQRRLYTMDDRNCVRASEARDNVGRKIWECRLVEDSGVVVDGEFFQNGKAWKNLEKRFNSSTCVRIFTDTVSFDELCLLRDALIGRRSMYNWIICKKDVIRFVEGYDGRVQ